MIILYFTRKWTDCQMLRIEIKGKIVEHIDKYLTSGKINYVYIRDSFVKSKKGGVFVRIYFATNKKYSV